MAELDKLAEFIAKVGPQIALEFRTAHGIPFSCYPGVILSPHRLIQTGFGESGETFDVALPLNGDYDSTGQIEDSKPGCFGVVTMLHKIPKLK